MCTTNNQDDFDKILETADPQKLLSPTDVSPSRIVIAKRLPVVCIGDSLTQQAFDNAGWVAQLSAYYQRKADVFDRGLSGYNSEWGRCYLDSMIASNVFPISKPEPSLVIVFFGANDAAWPLLSPQHTSLSRFRLNLHSLIDTIQSKFGPQCKLVMVTPPPVDGSKFMRLLVKVGRGTLDEPQARYNHFTKLYAKMVIRVAKHYKLPYVDLWSCFQQQVFPSFKTLDQEEEIHSGKYSKAEELIIAQLEDGTYQPHESPETVAEMNQWSRLYTREGLHLNNAGSDLVFNCLKQTIEQHHPEYSCLADMLPMDAPFWDQIDFKNPKQSFSKP